MGATDLISCHRDRNDRVSVQHHSEMVFLELFPSKSGTRDCGYLVNH